MKNKLKYAILTLFAAFICYHSSIAQQRDQQAVTIAVDLNKKTGTMYPFWAWFGHDEPNYTYMKDGKKLLAELAALSPTPVHMRVHNLLTTGDGTPALKWGSTNAYTEDANGKPVYNWRIIDSIFDTYIKLGMKPYAQIGFMPEALSSHPQPYRHHWQPGKNYNDIYTGWAYPPNDYGKWEELVYQWVKHTVNRYGKKEVESWYWEVWNEPNIDYWKGTMPEFFKMYDFAARGVKRALPTAKIGGPEVAGGSSQSGMKFLRAFIEHCISGTNYATGKTGSPLDVISFHAKGQPTIADQHVRMNMAPQLRDIAEGFKIVASYPQTKNLPIVIGESDPEGCAACGMATNPSNAYRNGTMYSSYTAASFARKYRLVDSLQVNFLGAVSWSFEFENQPWFFGFRDLATNGVDKPVLNVFRMFGMMTGDRVQVQSDRMYGVKAVIDSGIRGAKTDIGGLASKDKRSSAVMVWNYHDDDLLADAQPVSITVNGLPAGKVTLTHFRIDQEHSNSYEAWKKMGSPQNPSDAQVKELEQAGQLQTMGKPEQLKVTAGQLQLKITLPRQGVSLLKMSW
ncbi:GH39 family glycosyl hydrolase [Mucilaginibacter pocheonensis]|uniref:Xylan 1,4-beta-xylosidase n=1 Tax=Mucilaginibacter pocheonensis TaxID=398050 RepID=A0ABU1TAK5_9SPHI|nr:beta-xylosidase [Mucilaginibacter pocheonensis]MDR6942281.1 xylan 1,4-beta-xylosidase [Mucilaginibacter pocheonensis]